MAKYARNPDYAKPLQWGRLYDKHCPQRTDPYSRHAKLIAQGLRSLRSPMRRMLIDAGYEPDHWASSIEQTVKMLWEAREHLEYRDGEWRPRPSPASHQRMEVR